ncbi:hypothetical protein PDG61_21625 [Mycolicibacterium sp. BiH015]|uniref:DUF6636 domain-containing protein n=1 Tax=Mycolicibacterium sp. BiH015 TaxID=3018808 RepID=UPI0022E146E9|nr:DUF6636 domain-containing protein [Mycolicibacterium sp. BiH015]MDA2893531.1 hypothetical protein [Mycolicibacterium sp. BiH015]
MPHSSPQVSHLGGARVTTRLWAHFRNQIGGNTFRAAVGAVTLAAGVLTAGAHGPVAAASPDTLPTQAPAKVVTELTGFQSPSGNVGCYIDPTTVRCDIAERDWPVPARPADCDLHVDFGQGLILSAGGDARFVCAGDTALGYGDTLAYGSSIAAGTITCDSAESGMTCRDSVSEHGFAISRQAYQIF